LLGFVLLMLVVFIIRCLGFFVLGHTIKFARCY